MNMVNRPNEDDVECQTSETILDHDKWLKDINQKGEVDILIQWEGYEEPSGEPMEMLKVGRL